MENKVLAVIKDQNDKTKGPIVHEENWSRYTFLIHAAQSGIMGTGTVSEA